MTPQPVAYSYVRFSNPAQAAGDSLRRQTEAARAWCTRNGYRLDESTSLRDLGASAYVGTHRSNPDRFALAGFLKLVEAGKVPRGAALVVESLDRLSREHIRPALALVLNLIEGGIRVVQLAPAEAVYDEKVEPMSLMMAIMELSRGHSERAVKSERVGKAYQEKKRKVREGEHLYTSQVPAWVCVTPKGLKLIPERAKVVKLIFEMSANGYGLTAIVGKLIAEKVPAFGKSKAWKRSYVALMLKDRRALGEFQPKLRDQRTHARLADGKPVPDYFPAAVTADEYHAARAAADERRNPELKSSGGKGSGKTKTSKAAPAHRTKSKRHTVHATVNLFTGLIVSAYDPEDKYQALQRVETREGKTRSKGWSLINGASAEGRAKCLSFPLAIFEKVILGELQEIDPNTILGTDKSPNEALTLAGERADVEAQIARLEMELLKGDVPSISRTLRVLEDQRRDLVVREADALARAAVPTARAWGDAQPLLAAIAVAPDQEDARRRLRAALRRIIERITLLVVPRGRSRFAAVRIDFESGAHRDYIITHRPPLRGYHGGKPGRFEGGSEVWSEEAGEIDLRKSEDRDVVEAFLAAVDVEELADTIAAKSKNRKRLAKATKAATTRKRK